MSVIALIFVVLALLWLLYCIFGPDYSSVHLTPPALIKCIVGLLVLFVLYLIIIALFGAAVRIG